MVGALVANFVSFLSWVEELILFTGSIGLRALSANCDSFPGLWILIRNLGGGELRRVMALSLLLGWDWDWRLLVRLGWLVGTGLSWLKWGSQLKTTTTLESHVSASVDISELEILIISLSSDLFFFQTRQIQAVGALRVHNNTFHHYHYWGRLFLEVISFWGH